MSNTTNEYRFGGIYNIWKLVIERNLNVIRDTTLGSNYFPCQHVRFYFLTFTVNKNTNKIEAPADSCVAHLPKLRQAAMPQYCPHIYAGAETTAAEHELLCILCGVINVKSTRVGHNAIGIQFIVDTLEMYQFVIDVNCRFYKDLMV